MVELMTPQHGTPALALNNANAAQTSHLTADELANMLGAAFLALQSGDGCDGLLLAFDQDAAYQSENFLWFHARLPRFIYVDRIIVAHRARGRGLARQLYERLFAAATAAGSPCIACEINVRPPNPGSDAFHEAMGFEEVGRAQLRGRDKSVRYLTKTLAW